MPPVFYGPSYAAHQSGQQSSSLQPYVEQDKAARIGSIGESILAGLNQGLSLYQKYTQLKSTQSNDTQPPPANVARGQDAPFNPNGNATTGGTDWRKIAPFLMLGGAGVLMFVAFKS